MLDFLIIYVFVIQGKMHQTHALVSTVITLDAFIRLRVQIRVTEGFEQDLDFFTLCGSSEC